YYHLLPPPRVGCLGCNGILWSVGSQVNPEQPLGFVSGRKEDHGSLPHLHFGIRAKPAETPITRRDERTEHWFYPGYTTIHRSGQLQCNEGDPIHREIVSEWRNPKEFIEQHAAPV